LEANNIFFIFAPDKKANNMKWFKIFLILITAGMLMTGCKNYEEEIIGTWNFQTFDNNPQGTVTWTFKDNGDLIRISTLGGDIVFDTCDYIIDKSLFKKQVTITNSKMIPGQDDLNGVYTIEKFKEDIIVMTRVRLADDETAGAYLRCELMRKQ
jgi:hypothetical protein